MKSFLRMLLTLLMLLAGQAHATEVNAPLFINVTTQNAHRATMAIQFGKNQLELGHPLTIFLNDEGVYLATFIANEGSQDPLLQPKTLLKAVIAQGAKVLVCPMCMAHYGVETDRLMEGIVISNKLLIEPLLFAPGTQSLSW